MPKDLHELPKLRDSISYLYMEHAKIEQEDSSIVAIREDGRIPIPVSSVTCLLLGPGTRVTHAAIKAAADNGCMIIWCGERMSRFYASGMGETRSAANLLLQAKCCLNEDLHMVVVKRMYEIRFPSMPTKDLTLQQIRGLEGIRVKQTYRIESKRTGVKWSSRQYKQTGWDNSDDINRALSSANAILYSVCHAAITSLGFSPGLGFIHTGKMMSFVYDIADLYKTETSIPAAFEAVRDGKENLDQLIRKNMHYKIARANILRRVADDLARIFNFPLSEEQHNETSAGKLWDKDRIVDGGKNYSEEGIIM